MRKLDLGKGIAVIPASLAAATDREIDADRCSAFVVYPDGSTAADIAELVRAVREEPRKPEEESA